MRFTPLGANLIVKLEPEPELSSVIAVQRSVQDLCRFGEVLAIGPEVRDAKVGQRVLASITAGVEMAGGILINEQAVVAYVHV